MTDDSGRTAAEGRSIEPMNTSAGNVGRAADR
jgi:hypothetical protein